MSSSNCCFLTCIQISQEAGQEVWYSHLLKNFLQFIVIHTAKGFGIVNKAEIDVFLEFSCFFDGPADVGNLISGSSALSFPGGSDGKRVCMQCGRPGFNPWVRKISWRRKWQPTPILLPGKFHGLRSLISYSSWCHKESDTTERLKY